MSWPTSYNTTPPTPSYLAASRRGNELAAIIVTLTIASCFVVARLYSRRIILRTWGWDDTMILVAWILCITECGLSIVNTTWGMGRHIEAANPKDAGKRLVIAYAVRLVYQAALCATKLSIGIFYLRVFPERSSKVVCWTIMAFILLSTVVSTLLAIFQCSPVKDAWAIPPNQNCPINNNTIITFNGVSNIITDIALMTFVVPRILKLKMIKGQKVVLLCIVMTGSLVVIAAIVRLALTYDAVNSYDVTWDYALIGAWSVVETNVGLFCASVIAVRPLLRRIIPAWLPVSSYPGRSSGYVGSFQKHSRDQSHLTDTPDVELAYDSRSAVKGVKCTTWSGQIKPCGSLNSLRSDQPLQPAATEEDIMKANSVTTEDSKPVSFLGRQCSEESVVGRDDREDVHAR